jgi:uncharacterized iron-regulated membrane protein
MNRRNSLPVASPDKWSQLSDNSVYRNLHMLGTSVCSKVSKLGGPTTLQRVVVYGRYRLSFRKLVLTLHLWAGLLAGAFLLMLGTTGCLLVYERGIDQALNRRLVHVQPMTQPLPLGKLFSDLEKAHPGYHVTDMAFSREPDIGYQMYLNPGANAEGFVTIVNQYNGLELGSASTANQFMNFVNGLHTHLLMETHRETGRFIVGVSSILLLFLSCSGLVLWWRRKLFVVNWSTAPGRINFDLHNMLGAFFSLFLFCFSLTGIALAWDESISKIVNRVTRSYGMPVTPEMPEPPSGAAPLGVDQILVSARAALPGAEIDSLSMHPGEPVDLRMKFPEDRTPVGRSRVRVDPYTGSVLNVWNTRTAPIGFKINRMWIREIHSGDIFGWPTRILACIASLVLPILTITGTLIWWHRRRRFVARNF